MKLRHFPDNDPIVIRTNIGKNTVHFFGNDVGQVLVDTGSSTDIITWQFFVKIGLSEKNLTKAVYPLIGFGRKKDRGCREGKIERNLR